MIAMSVYTGHYTNKVDYEDRGFSFWLAWSSFPISLVAVYLNTIRISMKTALVTATIAMLWTVEWDYIFHCKFTFLPKPLVTAIFNFIPGFSLLLATSVFEFQFNQEFVKPARKWALYLTYVICVLCFLSGVYNLVCYKYSLWEGTVYSGKISSSKTQQEDEQPQTSLG